MRLCLCLILLLASAPAQAGAARSALDRFADGLVSLEGRFQQQVYNMDGSLREEGEGSLALMAPRLFRWHAEQPYEQLVVADGSHVWLYDVDLEQVTVRRQADQEAQSPLAVLTDPGSLERRYRVSEIGRDQGLDWLRLEPVDPDAEFVRAELGLDGDGLRRMRMEDRLGGRSEIGFGPWRRNGLRSAEPFRFTPPEEVDVIGDVESVAEIRALPEASR